MAVRATPRAARSRIAGAGQDADGRAVLLVRIAAPPAEGAANAALIDLLAAALAVRKRDVAVQSGETARNKQVHVAGDARALGERLSALLTG
ncbi:MAG: DUF167 family protein [Blastomonas sp.]|nr:DUF167 family protein [Blastomonas sp.]MDM7956707.1 DUF167 family protein [Blastomonas sp.]